MKAIRTGAYIVILLSWCISAHSEIYKCSSSDGKVNFSDKPCSTGEVKKDGKWVSAGEYEKYKTEELKNQEETERKRAEKESEEIWERMRRRELAEERERQLENKKHLERNQTIKEAQDMGLHVIEYVVGGSAKRAALTYTNESGGTEQHSVRIPWSKVLKAGEGDITYISAQNGDKYGTVTVTIKVDGTPVKFSESSSSYGIARASSSL